MRKGGKVGGHLVVGSLVQSSSSHLSRAGEKWRRYISSLRAATEPCTALEFDSTSRDSAHKFGKGPLWIDSQLAWVQGKLLTAQSAGVALAPNPPVFYPASQHEQSGRMASPSEVGTWSKLCEEGQLDEAVEALHVLVGQGSYVPDAAFYRLLKGCILEKNLSVGKRIHALTLDSGYECTTFLANHFIRMYASHVRLQDAMEVFAKLATPNVFSWFYVISAHVEHGQPVNAIRLYQQMRRSPVKPNNHVFVAALKACASTADLESGKQVHAEVLGSKIEPDLFVGNSLVDMYAKCGSLEDAIQVFDSLKSKNVVTWTSMIAGYVEHGRCREALSLYARMQQEGRMLANHVTFSCLLKACASTGALLEGKELHTQIQERGLEADVVIGSSLVDMYVKCGSVEDARKVFDRLHTKDVVTWTAMIGGYVQCGLGQEALSLYTSMQQQGHAVANNFTFASLLKACASIGDLHQGKELHLEICKRGLEGDVVVGRSLVDMYAKCGSLNDARYMFERLPARDAATWTSMIAGCAQQGLAQEALSLFASMQHEGLGPANNGTFACLLKACASSGALREGKELHRQIQAQGLETDLVVGSCLVEMYAKCGSLEDAHRVFDRMPARDATTWNAILAGYAQNRLGQEALTVFANGEQEASDLADHVTFLILLRACASLGALQYGKELHLKVKQRGFELDIAVGTALVDMYAKCGSIEDARSVFDSTSAKDVVAWNAMITGYVQHGLRQDALTLFAGMPPGITPNRVTFMCLLKACAGIGDIHAGKDLHLQIQRHGLEADIAVSNGLVDMYAKCGSLEDARRVFESMPARDGVTWNSLIGGYAQQGLGREALSLYRCMQLEAIALADRFTFVCLLNACAGLGDLQEGRELHLQLQERGLEADLVVGSSVVNMYAKCGSLEDARRVFDRLPARDLVTWNTMITGYVQQGLGQEALTLHARMQMEGMRPSDAVTFVCLLKACASVGALHQGKELHSQIQERGLEANEFVGSSLVDMYAKCATIEEARKVFDRLPTKNVVAWTALLNGYAEHNNGRMGIQCFHEMEQQGIKPDGAAFLSLLVACSHAGLVDEGQQYFERMVQEHGITPGVYHYASMVDILGRAGRLDEAEKLLYSMPFENDVVGWRALLNACKSHGDTERGARCFEHLVKLEPENAAAYVLLGNLYADAGMWRDVERVENLRKCAGAFKKAARAWIEVDSQVHTFVVGEERDDISVKLSSLNCLLKDDGGHVPHTQLVLKRVSEREKEDALCGHAEKLALAYGLLNTPEGTALLVTKNLRMCNDCHSGTKVLSRIEKREIIVRDAHRVHHFVNGFCSCGDGH